MSEEAVAGSVPASETSPAPAPSASAGELLRQARVRAGVELSALAVALKVSVKKLEALESDRYDQLPDAVFVRALASSVCRALKVDPGAVLALLPQSRTPRLDHDEVGLNTPFHTPGDVAKTPFLDRLSRPMILAALAVLMGALVLIFFPSTEQRAELGAIVASTPAAPTQAPTVAAPVAAVQAPAPAPEPPAPSVAAVTKPAPVSVPSVAKPAGPTPVPVAAPSVAPREAPAAAARPAAAPAEAAVSADGEQAAPRKKLPTTGVVVFKTREASWIEVTDGKGTIQLSRMIEPGEPVGASGPLPLSVTIGRADVTEVTVRGKPFALDEVTRGGVARFEVK